MTTESDTDRFSQTITYTTYAHAQVRLAVAAARDVWFAVAAARDVSRFELLVHVLLLSVLPLP